MKAKWMVWSLAATLCVASFTGMARAQEPRDPAPSEIGAPPGDGPDGFEAPGEMDGLDLLLAAEVSDPAGPGMGSGRGRRAELRAQLNLTDEQTSKLAEIRDKTQRAVIPIQADLRIAALDMRKLMRAEKPDSRAIDAQVDKIAGLRGSLQKKQVAGVLEARAVLTPAQQKIMREQRGAMMRGMHGMRGMRGGRGARMQDW